MRTRRLRCAGIFVLAAVAAALAVAPAAAGTRKGEGPPQRPDTRLVMFVGNNWGGTADIIDVRTFKRLGRINVIPDKQEREREIFTNPVRLAFFLGIRQFVGEGNDQYVDDMFTTHDGTLVAVSRPSYADVVGIDLRTKKIVWRFTMEGQRSDHMAVSPDGTKLVVSDSTANKAHELDIRTGKKTGEFPSGDSPHENNYSADGNRIYHASIGRVYTPTDRELAGGFVRDTSKGERYFQIVDAQSLRVLERFDMGKKLEQAGYPEMSSAVRPMALAPDEKTVYVQVSFHHGFVEYSFEQDRVLRVANLPVTEEAQKIPREQYLLDSAHHGLAMNPEGTTLCAAGTMSNYAALVDRQTFSYKLFHGIGKPYWSTNGPEGRYCWVSASADDNVAIIDYETGRLVTKVAVGNHPQRVRVGAVRRSFLPGLPIAAGARDNLAPQITVKGVPRRCRRSSFRARVTIRDQSPLRAADARVGSRRLRRTRKKTFNVRVPVQSMRRGTHRLRVRATDTAGNRGRRTVRFSRCAGAARSPALTG